MRIGYSSVFGFRPHVEHTYYLSRLAEEAGASSFYFVCDSSVPTCYNRILKQQGAAKACTSCIAGGLRSYPPKRTFSANARYRIRMSEGKWQKIVESSAASLHRIETPEQLKETVVQQTIESLRDSVEIIYGSAMSWIKNEKLDGMVLFNGRMDLTRALIEACNDSGIPFISHERPWFGHGLLMIPGEGCLSLKENLRMVADFKDRPLTILQAQVAAKILSLRFRKKNDLEWRVFNKDAASISWPNLNVRKKILLTPGSFSEIIGHPERSNSFIDEYTQLYDRVIQQLKIEPSEVVVRGHPIWCEKIGSFDGWRADELYREWAKRNGMLYISPATMVDTNSLIEQADLIICSGGSTGLEAATLGKKVVVVGSSVYNGAGFAADVIDENSLANVNRIWEFDDREVVRKALRFTYLYSNRFPQFVQFARAQKPTSYEYFSGANGSRILEMLSNQKVSPDDCEIGENQLAEDSLIHALLNKEWVNLSSYEEPYSESGKLDISRRSWLKWLDRAREAIPQGDRLG